MKLILKNCPNKETEQDLRRAFKATTEALWVDNYAVEVQAEVSKGEATITNAGFFAKVNAQMGETEDHLEGNVAKMRLFTFNTPQLIHTFIHELVHVAQMVRGDLKRVGDVAVWKGRRYPEPRTHDEYQNQPWELEAEAFANRISKRL